MRYLTVLLCVFAGSSGFEDKSVYQCLIDHGFNTFASLLQTANLDPVLSGQGPFTVFAPTDAAFQKLDPGRLTALQANRAELKSTLEYHVVKQYVIIPLLSDHQSVKSVEGDTLMLRHEASNFQILQINNVSTVDFTNVIYCNNGNIEPVDTVIFPNVHHDASLNLAQIIMMKEDKFRDFSIYLLLADVLHLLESGDFTIFAPTNEAFGLVSSLMTDPSIPRPSLQQSREIIKYYIVPGGRPTSSLRDGQKLMTLHGTMINVTIPTPGRILINGVAHIVDADIPASNGFINSIDAWIPPMDVVDQFFPDFDPGLVG